MDRFVKCLLPLSLGFISGIAIFSLFRSYAPFAMLTVIFTSAVFAGLSTDQLYPKTGILTLAVLLSVWIGGLHTQNHLESLEDGDFGKVIYEKEVLVVSEAEAGDVKTRYTVKTENGNRWLMITSLYPKFEYGTKLTITGEVLEPPVFEDFNYKAYLKKESIEAVIYHPDIDTVKEPSPSVRGSLLSLKKRFRENLYSSLPHPHDTIAGAMVLGDGYLIPDRVKEVFSSTGIRHVVAISGLHVTIIGGIVMTLLMSTLTLGRNMSFYFTSIFIILFVIFVGAPPSAIRAGIMATVLLFALKTGKVYSAPRALLFAAILMLLINPLLLIYDIGFQLSFLSVLGIVYMTPHIERGLGRDRSFLEERELSKNKKGGLLSLISVSLSAHLSTLPLVAYNFNIVSLSAPIANLLAVPMLPIIMISSMSTALLGSLSETISYLLAIPAYVCLETLIRSTRVLDATSISSIEINIDSFWLILSYSFIAAVTLILELKRSSLINQTSPSLAQLPPSESRPF